MDKIKTSRAFEGRMTRVKKELSKEQREQIIRLRKIREEMQLSQEQFADLLDISTSAYKKIETFERQISLMVLKKINQKLHASVDYILYGEKEGLDATWKAVLNCNERDKMILFLRLYQYFVHVKNENYPLPEEEQANLEKIFRMADDL
ncbi:MAG: helix-turn-helix transcriptional regulator [Lachnospiraceae bacterium]|nr:helix-turn-helix transcriptional regulator [Lachnospiraceae bacterium]